LSINSNHRRLVNINENGNLGEATRMILTRVVVPKDLGKGCPGTGQTIWGQTIRHVYLAAVVTAIFVALPQGPVSAAQDTSELIELSLEQLMNVQVTSVARKPQRVSESAAAVHVISSEDIRRSGATSIPELLRNVRGLNVARIDSSKWAI
jgi:hypothetical protein